MTSLVTGLLQLVCVLAEVGACVAWWTWQWRRSSAVRQPALLASAASLAALAVVAAGWLCALGEGRFLVAMFGFYIIAGFGWAVTARGRSSDWNAGEGAVLAVGVLVASAGFA